MLIPLSVARLTAARSGSTLVQIDMACKHSRSIHYAYFRGSYATCGAYSTVTYGCGALYESVGRSLARRASVLVPDNECKGGRYFRRRGADGRRYRIENSEGNFNFYVTTA